MEIIWEVLAFGGKVCLVTIGVVVILLVLGQVLMRLRPAKERLEITNYNEKVLAHSDAIREVISDPKAFKKELKLRDKSEKKLNPSEKKHIFVLDFEGDIAATDVTTLREEVTAILASARPAKDEVVLRLESSGGMVHAYGLAAAQLLRFKQNKIPLTICVDKVAASGGYMMACMADQLLAAPFAIVGSVGVIAQVPNVHRVLQKHDIDYEEITAGDFKRTISVFAEITPKGRQKFVEQIEDTHHLFKEYVKSFRPQLNLDQIATGEYWFGTRALALQLVDRLQSSDDYLFSQRELARILEIKIESKRSFGERLSEKFAQISERVLFKLWQRLQEQSIFKS